jgi:hypothetical protein
MTLKRALVFSLLVGLVSGVGAYVLAWGFFTAHPEAGMEPARGRVIALAVAPLVFVVSMIYFRRR